MWHCLRRGDREATETVMSENLPNPMKNINLNAQGTQELQENKTLKYIKIN